MLITSANNTNTETNFNLRGWFNYGLKWVDTFGTLKN